MAAYLDIASNARANLILSNSKDGQKIIRIDGHDSNFKVLEFRCKDGADQILLDTQLVCVLQRIRDFYGDCVWINSAFRTQSHNERVGGSPNSQHLYGKAADIHVRSQTLADNTQLAMVAELAGASGIGLYGDFVHVDVRQGKSLFLGKGALNSKVIRGGSFLPFRA